MEPTRFTFRNLEPVAEVLAVLFRVSMTWDLIRVLRAGWTLLGGRPLSLSTPLVEGPFESLGTLGVFGFFVWRAARNARAIQGRELDVTPFGAFASFFVPIGNLWLPYQSLKSIWQNSVSVKAHQDIEVPPRLPLWWWLFIVQALGSNAALRYAASESWSVSKAAWATLVIGPLSIAASALSVWMVRAFATRQASAQRPPESDVAVMAGVNVAKVF